VIEGIRTERRFGVTAELTTPQRRNLFTVRNSEGWSDVLDVMEMCCIEMESKLINTEPAAEADVLANHRMAKAAWQIFTHLQAKIDDEISLYLSGVAPKPLVPPMSREEQDIENMLDPTRPLPDYAEN
jgi:hypothetical protein